MAANDSHRPPAGVVQPIVVSYRPVNRGALVAEVKVLFATGWIVTTQLFEKDGRRWVSPPSRSFKDRNGGTSYRWLLEFSSPYAQDNFQAEVLSALAQFTGNESTHASDSDAGAVTE